MMAVRMRSPVWERHIAAITVEAGRLSHGFMGLRPNGAPTTFALSGHNLRRSIAGRHVCFWCKRFSASIVAAGKPLPHTPPLARDRRAGKILSILLILSDGFH